MNIKGETCLILTVNPCHSNSKKTLQTLSILPKISFPQSTPSKATNRTRDEEDLKGGIARLMKCITKLGYQPPNISEVCNNKFSANKWADQYKKTKISSSDYGLQTVLEMQNKLIDCRPKVCDKSSQVEIRKVDKGIQEEGPPHNCNPEEMLAEGAFSNSWGI